MGQKHTSIVPPQGRQVQQISLTALVGDIPSPASRLDV